MQAFFEKHFGKFWLVAIFLFLYLPLMFMVVFSFNSTRQDAVFTGFSWRWYEALTRDTKIVDGFWLSIKVAAITGVMSAPVPSPSMTNGPPRLPGYEESGKSRGTPPTSQPGSVPLALRRTAAMQVVVVLP